MFHYWSAANQAANLLVDCNDYGWAVPGICNAAARAAGEEQAAWQAMVNALQRCSNL